MVVRKVAKLLPYMPHSFSLVERTDRDSTKTCAAEIFMEKQ